MLQCDAFLKEMAVLSLHKLSRHSLPPFFHSQIINILKLQKNKVQVNFYFYLLPPNVK